MDDAPLLKNAHSIAPANASAPTVQIGQVTAVSGFKLTCLLLANRPENTGPQAYSQLQIGALIKIPTPSTMAFGFINGLELRHESAGQLVRHFAVADIELLGELAPRDIGGPPVFSRGISIYPTLGAPLFSATSDDLARIYDKPNSWTVAVGTLHQDPSRTAYLLSQELLSKHSAILGTTGSGKSCALTLIVRALLEAHPNGHVVLLDPHGEYAPAFQGLCERITPQNLQLPYWLLSFDEIVELLCSKDEATRSREAYILKDVIIAAKRDALGAASDTMHLTVDTPTPYPLASLLHRLSDAMGKLDKPDNALPYFRLMTTIENLRQDKRYAFLFGSLSV
jgi:hypothetical protein